ncbi:hypothetical protein [Candidatus Liberibacter sp.]|uniref:hypothetical protein n=1 Tax=Candidatus Liberibacter sp. TaxID=34022 RepID=UPI0015F5C7DE|nr:hypothetical protein [Candidatus Liberibacter sp.]MBA5723905.1 hypothetical protein [Candidatus Liberibacter sp.]
MPKIFPLLLLSWSALIAFRKFLSQSKPQKNDTIHSEIKTITLVKDDKTGEYK